MDNQDTGIIKLNPGLLAALSSGGISIDVMPREILVLECVVAGTSFRDLSKVEAALQCEVRITLRREQGNLYDTFAVALFYEDHKIGYLPKAKNESIARLQDAGKQFYAILAAREKEGSWLRLDIKVYLKD